MSMGDVITVSVDNQELSLQPGNKINVIVTCDEIADGVYGDNVTVTGRFTDANNRAISNSNVRVFVNGKKYLARTDKNGFYSVAVRVTAVGVNNVSVGYGGSEKYDAYEANATFNAVKQDVIVTYDSIPEVSVGDNLTITGKFIEKINPLKKTIFCFYREYHIINNKKYFAKTDLNGIYKFSTKITNNNINNVTLGYGGNDKYNEYSTNVVISVKK